MREKSTSGKITLRGGGIIVYKSVQLGPEIESVTDPMQLTFTVEIAPKIVDSKIINGKQLLPLLLLRVLRSAHTTTISPPFHHNVIRRYRQDSTIQMCPGQTI